MTSFSINETPVFPEGLSKQALLDPSLSYTYVPESIAQDIFSQFVATETPTSRPVSILCNTTFSDTTLMFEFETASFKLDIDPFIETRSVFNDEDICYLGIVAKTDTKDANCVQLGANFLQQVYIVYDICNDEISLAQRNWNFNEDEILEITAGKNAVPVPTLERGAAMTQKPKMPTRRISLPVPALMRV